MFFFLSSGMVIEHMYVGHIHLIESIDSQSVPSSTPEIINLETADSPPVQHPSTLRRLLLQQFLGDDYDLNNDDDDDDNEESQSQ